MIYTEAAPQTFTEPLVGTAATQPPPEQPSAANSTRVDAVTEAPTLRVEQQPAPRRHILARIAAGVALANVFAGTVLLGGASRAEAATPAMSAEALPQSSSFEWTNVLAGLGLVVTAIAIARQTNEKTADRFHAALKDIEGESTGEERLIRLDALKPFAKRREYKPWVLSASATYLRGRRGNLLLLRQRYAGQPVELEAAITEKRNADREAFKLFLKTLPLVRRQMHRQEFAKRMKRLTKIAYRGSDEHELERIDEATGLEIEAEKPRVYARGINLDDMRDVQSCNLRDVDLRGAGLQRNDIKRVSFRRASAAGRITTVLL